MYKSNYLGNGMASQNENRYSVSGEHDDRGAGTTET